MRFPRGEVKEDAAEGEAVKGERRCLNMPGYDGRGPRGMGPMTGWGRGSCSTGVGFAGGAYGAGPGFGRGGGRARGFGRGFGWRTASPAAGWGYAPGPAWGPSAAGSYRVSREDEAGFLRQEAEAIREELNAIQQRIRELESRDSSS